MEIHLSPQEFNRKFRHSPIRRARRRGYLRNIAVALGNQKDADSVSDLAQVIETEPEPLVRVHAAWALGQLNTHPSRQVLDRAFHREEDETVRQELQDALDETGR